MPIDLIWHLPNYERIEYVVYYVQMTRFNTFSKIFLTQLCYIPLKHYENYNIIYGIIQNLILYEFWSLLNKDP